MELKVRNPYFDNAKAILIGLVIVGHIFDPFVKSNRLIETIYWLIYSFHMPAFVFISGYFAKSTKNLLKTEGKFLLLYIIFSILYLPFSHYNLLNTIIFPFWILWYMVSLICWYAMVPFLKRINRPALVLTVSFILGILIGYIDTAGILVVSKTLYFMPFFLLGFYATEINLENLRTVFKKSYAYFIMAVILILAFIFSPRINHAILWATDTYSSLGYTQWYAGIKHIFQYVFNITALVSFLVIIPQARKFYTAIGKHTLSIYLLHGFVIQAFYYLLRLI